MGQKCLMEVISMNVYSHQLYVVHTDFVKTDNQGSSVSVQKALDQTPLVTNALILMSVLAPDWCVTMDSVVTPQAVSNVFVAVDTFITQGHSHVKMLMNVSKAYNPVLMVTV
jgi:hypothetical protein